MRRAMRNTCIAMTGVVVAGFSVVSTAQSSPAPLYAAAPKLGEGMVAVRLADGRVLAVGGLRTEKQALVYDPRRDRWEATGGLNFPRVYAAIAALPDGRAFVAGTGWQSGDRGESGHSAELWDPRTGRWTPLSPLPLSYRITAHHATGPSAAALPDGSLVVAGGMHKHVILLRAKGGGFAPYWTVAGSLPDQRVSGVVRALGNNAVGVTGGFVQTDRGCCWRQNGEDRIEWTGDGAVRPQSVSLERKEAVLARRGETGFAGGGWESFYMSFQATQASAVAELIDYRSGRARQLPPLPHPMLTGRAMWLDDDRVLVKAVAHAALYEQPFRGIDGRSLEQESKGFLAMYSVRRQQWNVLNDPRIATAFLADATENSALLAGPDGRLWTVALGQPGSSAIGEVKALRPAARRRANAAIRLLADGHVVIAGGEAQSELVREYDPECDRPDCPAQFIGLGPLSPSQHHEILDPATGRWRQCAPSRSTGRTVVVRADGRVVRLGLPAGAGGGPILEESNATGTLWRRLPIPQYSSGPAPDLSRCKLLTGEDAARREALLLSCCCGGSSAEPEQDLWLFDDAASRWTLLGEDFTEARMFERRVAPPQSGATARYGELLLRPPVLHWTTPQDRER